MVISEYKLEKSNKVLLKRSKNKKKLLVNFYKKISEYLTIFVKIL
jgi:lipopolysaccharide export LptBFGC system permease protein LptF